MANLTQIELQIKHICFTSSRSTNKANIHKISTRCFKHKAKTNVIFKYLSYGGYENG